MINSYKNSQLKIKENSLTKNLLKKHNNIHFYFKPQNFLLLNWCFQKNKTFIDFISMLGIKKKFEQG